jgi:hypothetical protein
VVWNGWCRSGGVDGLAWIGWADRVVGIWVWWIGCVGSRWVEWMGWRGWCGVDGVGVGRVGWSALGRLVVWIGLCGSDGSDCFA